MSNLNVNDLTCRKPDDLAKILKSHCPLKSIRSVGEVPGATSPELLTNLAN